MSFSGGDIIGGAKKYANDHDNPIAKDNIIAELIPTQITECSLCSNRGPNDPCMSMEAVTVVAKSVGVEPSAKPLEVISIAKEKLKCDTERCVLTKLTPYLGADRVRKEINTYLKPKGPTDAKLLSNIQIDTIMKQWSITFPDFFPYNFNMLNYSSYAYDNGYVIHRPDTLATISFTDLYTGAHDGKKYKCAGCIINSGTYQSDGEHWMALFADARGDEWTAEFFNSSGNSPAPEWISWLEKTRVCMEIIDKEKNIPVKVVRVTSIRHQQSRSECGLYSLFYIWARLHKVRPEYFQSTPIPDQLMFEFRQHLFEDPTYKTVHTFDWDKYKNIVKITWE